MILYIRIVHDTLSNKKPLRICLVTEEFPGQNDLGGIGYHFFHLGKELVKRGHQVTVLYDGNQYFTIYPGVEVIGVWWRSSSLLHRIYSYLQRFELSKVFLWSWQAKRTIDQLETTHDKFTIIETHDYHLTPWFLSLGKDRLIISLHGGKKQTALLNNEYTKLGNKVLSLVEHLTLKKAPHLYAVSPLQARKTKQLNNIEVKTVIPNPVDTSFFVPAKSRHVREVPYILYVGRFEKRKGILALLNAYTALATGKEGAKLPHLYCVGEDCAQFGQYQDFSFRELGEALPLTVQQKIKFFPYLPQKKLLQLYQHALCCICPSVEEPFGYVVAEAMSCGQVVIVSCKAGITQWLHSGKDALIVQPTTKELEATLRKVICQPAAYVSLKKQARATIEKYFQPNVVANQVEKYYRSILRQPGSEI